MTQAEVEAKALDLIGGVLGKDRAAALVRTIGRLETVADVTALRPLWSAPIDAAGKQAAQ
jgi:hypothetical protein